MGCPLSIATRTSQSSILRARHHPDCTCDSDTVDALWKAELCRILHAEDRKPNRKLLDELAAGQETSVTRAVSRIRRATRLDPGDQNAAMSYFGRALIKMIDERWRSKIGPGTSAVFDHTHNLPTVLESEARSYIRDDLRRGVLDGAMVDASRERA